MSERKRDGRGLGQRWRERISGGRRIEDPIRSPSRVAALRRSELLDTPSEEVFDRLTRIAARALDAPVALLTLVDADRQFCKSMVGLPEVWLSGRDTPLSYSFCQHAVALGVPLVIEDARRHPLVRTDPATLRGVIAYAGIPLVTSDGHALGTLCAIDFQPRAWGDQEVQLLAELAAAVVTKIELRVAARESEEKARAAERAREALRESEERFRTAFDAAPIGMALVSTDGRWIRVNDALCSIVGYGREELLGGSFQDITHPDDQAADLEQLESLLSGEIPGYALEKRYLHKEGREVWILLSVSLVRDSRGEPFHFIAQIQDVTERRREEDRLRSLSFLDDLTGLYNRRAFTTLAGEQLKLARRQERHLLLIFADVDEMKGINDSMGHLEGDRALTRIADLLRRTFRESDLIARIGGDEFAVLAHVPRGSEAAVLGRFRHWLRVAGEDESTERGYPLSLSLGAALFDPAEPPCTLESLIARADAAMYAQKGRQPAA